MKTTVERIYRLDGTLLTEITTTENEEEKITNKEYVFPNYSYPQPNVSPAYIPPYVNPPPSYPIITYGNNQACSNDLIGYAK